MAANTTLCKTPIPHTRQSKTVQAGMAKKVKSREPLGAHIGMVTRPRARSPATSGKSWTWMVVEITSALQNSDIHAMSSRTCAAVVDPRVKMHSTLQIRVSHT